MHIALVTDGIYPYVMGGMQRHSYYLAKLFAKRGLTLTLYHTAPTDEAPNLADSGMFTPEELARIQAVWVPFPVSSIPFPGHYLWESWQYASRIYQELTPRLNEFDFIYTKGFAGWKLIREKDKGLKAPPVGINFHGYEMFQIPPSKRAILEHQLLRPPVRALTRQADYVFSYGANITRIISNLGVPSEQIIEIPTGIGVSWVRKDPPPLSTTKGRRFVFVGRFERRKGIQELLQAAKELSNQEKFTLDLIGPIPESQQEPLPGVQYLGPIRDNASMQTQLDTADVLLCPSYSEGMPNVIMEGMARGCAIIATDVGAVPIQVNAENGWLIPAGDQDALRNAMLDAIQIAPQALHQKRVNSWKKVQQGFVWDEVAAQTQELLQQIVKH